MVSILILHLWIEFEYLSACSSHSNSLLLSQCLHSQIDHRLINTVTTVLTSYRSSSLAALVVRMGRVQQLQQIRRRSQPLLSIEDGRNRRESRRSDDRLRTPKKTSKYFCSYLNCSYSHNLTRVYRL